MPQGAIFVNVYDEELAKMCAARLNLCAVRFQIEAESSKAYVYERNKTSQETQNVKARLVSCLKWMESYVGTLNSEWADCLPRLAPNVTHFPVPRRLDEFLGHEAGAEMKIFQSEYQLALFILRSPSLDDCHKRIRTADIVVAANTAV